MKFAVIQTGGKQYKIKELDVLKVEKIESKDGKLIKFDKVLLKADDKNVAVGTPYLKEAVVEAEVLEQGKAKKVTVIKYKPKIRYKKKVGHRQLYTKIKITKI